MRPELWPQVESLLDEVLALPTERREPHLRDGQGRSQEVCDEVLHLVACEEEAETFLELPALALLVGDENLDAPDLGQRLGPYRLVRVLGVGGMSTVYLGRREDQVFEGQVAIKVLRQELVGPTFRRRFQQERQILASLQHPHIARLLDGGTTDNGRPYLVLEWVRGLPIDRFCDRHRLSLRQRVRLMIQVCEAVEHAHRNLLVHRDLKPSNILVQEDRQPKLLDFGIAKILEEGSLPVPQEITGTHLRPMTLPYASPEQVRGEAVTTASDAYALGVVLYRLLTGQGPYRLEENSTRELESAILEQTPASGSEAVTVTDLHDAQTAASARRTDLRAWRRGLEGDLETVLAKALRKEPERRYGSARELAEDLGRFLEHRPILARSDSWFYRFRKLVRRNPWASGAASAALSFLVLLAVVSTEQARRIARERDYAVAARQESQQVTEFLIDLLDSGSPDAAGGGAQLTVREVLRRSTVRLEELSDQPQLKAQLAATLGELFLSLELVTEAEPLLRQAVDLRRSLFGTEHPAVAGSLGALATWYRLTGDLSEAQRLQKEALDLQVRLLGPDDPVLAKSLMGLGLIHYDQGEFALAEARFREALRIRNLRADIAPRDQADTHNDLAFSLHAVGKYQQAESHYREALKLLETGGEGNQAARSVILNNLASVLQEQGKVEQAEPLFRDSIVLRQEIYGATNVKVAAPVNKLAWMKMYLGEPEDLSEAEELFEQALRLRLEHFGGEHPMTAFSRIARARIWLELGRAAAAEQEARQALAQLEGKLPEDHWRRRIGDFVLGGALLRQEKPEEGERLLRSAYESLKASIGAAEPRTRDALALLIEAQEALGNRSEAAALRQEVLPPAGQ